jgi:hypothetical protein
MSKEEKKQQTITEVLYKVKKELGVLTKNSKNPYFKSDYADLNQHLKLVEPLFQKHGLILTQPVMTNGSVNMVSTEITLKNAQLTERGDYRNDQIAKSQLSIPQTDDMQKLGSAITYARRYTLGSLLGLQSVDDDGNLASGKQTKSSNVSIF